MARKFVINTSRVNSYGTRVLTAGIDTGQFKRNPVLLYMHRRDHGWERDAPMVIGRVENVEVDGDNLIGEPVFDMADDFAAKIARKWEEDFLRMCSAGLEPIEFSSAPEHVAQGQTRATITKSKLVEVSIVDIGANDDALQLYEPGGKLLNLAAGASDNLLPLLNTETENKPINLSMDKILLLLGLVATASESDALAAITKLQGDAKRAETLELAHIESAVNAAIEAKKLLPEKREQFVALGKAAGFEHLNAALGALTPAVKPMNLINAGGGSSASTTQLTYAQMSEEQLLELRAGDPERFAKLFEAEFGFKPSDEK